MLNLLHFAYFEAMGAWTVPYALAGLFATFIAGRRLGGWLRWPATALTVALFFSLSLVVGRTAAPVPTLFAVGLWTIDTVRLAVDPACQAAGDGCIGPELGGAVIVVPFLIQWLLVYVLLAAGAFAWRAVGRRRSSEPGS
jgi:hypothetical protein